LGSGLPRYSVATTEAMLAAARGWLDLAAAALAESDAESSGWQGDLLAHAARAAATWLRASGDLAGCLSRIDGGLVSLEALDDTFLRSSLAAFGTGVAADLAEQAHGMRKAGLLTEARERATRYAALADAIASERLIDGAQSVPLTRANGMLAAAEAQRALGHDNAFAWPPVIAAFEDRGMAPDVAYLNYRLGCASLAAGNTVGATEALRAARDTAAGVGMTVLGREIDAVARLGRIELEPRVRQRLRTSRAAREPARQAPSADPWGLSTREREVLSLLADGRTNGEIGLALFISTKTASVHVTHILDKLGVSSRTEAALLAVRAGQIATRPTPPV
jgi:DNA-binding CsgD family transcriptional regulator